MFKWNIYEVLKKIPEGLSDQQSSCHWSFSFFVRFGREFVWPLEENWSSWLSILLSTCLEEQHGNNFSKSMELLKFLSLFLRVAISFFKVSRGNYWKTLSGEILLSVYLGVLWGSFWQVEKKNRGVVINALKVLREKFRGRFFWIRHSISFLYVGGKFSGLTMRNIFQPQLSDLHVRVQKILCRKVQKKFNSHFLLPPILGCVKQSDKHARKCKNCSLCDLGKSWGNTLPLIKLNFQGFFQKCERKFPWLLTNSFRYFCIFCTPRVQTSK